MRCELDRIDDLVVTGAAADVARNGFLDVLRCRLLGPIEQRFYGHYESRGAVAALHRARVDERLLHGMQFIALGKSFDGRDFRAIGICGHDELVFEVPSERLNEARALIEREMTQATELRCGLAVEIHSGTNWAEAHA